jgi:hypothetical protein
MRATGGVWDKKTWPLYFLATWPDQVEYVDTRTNLLVAVNELVDPEKRMLLEEWAEQDRKIFLDSGVYWLATQHARAHGMSMNEALGIAPDKMDGFEDLFAAYVEIVKGYEAICGATSRSIKGERTTSGGRGGNWRSWGYRRSRSITP